MAEQGGGLGVLPGSGTGVGEDLALVGDDQVVDLDALRMDAQAQGAAGYLLLRQDGQQAGWVRRRDTGTLRRWGRIRCPTRSWRTR
ncbi:hypothetical protein AAGT00_34965 [Streptomyces cavourensis]